MSGRACELLPVYQQHALCQGRAPCVPNGQVSNEQNVLPRTAPNLGRHSTDAVDWPVVASAILDDNISHCYNGCTRQQHCRRSTGGWGTTSPPTSCMQPGFHDPAVWLSQMKQTASNKCKPGKNIRSTSSDAIHPYRLHNTVRPKSAHARLAANMQTRSSWQRQQQRQRCNQSGDPTEIAGLLLQDVSISHHAAGQLHHHGPRLMMRPSSAPAGVRSRQQSGSNRGGNSNCLPARRAVTPSPAGQVMTKVLRLHNQRRSGELL
jgi:hypothetical protein